jgi:16S rRNA (cytosine967-C5)-methyltransferase
VSQLAELQGALLRSAVRALKPGGVLAYVTCSPHLGETRAAVAGALAAADGELTQLDTGAILSTVTTHPLDLGTNSGHVQLWPHRHGTDAMFICLLQKSA